MSEDRLDKAIEAMKNEIVDPEKIENARNSVWENLESVQPSVCGEFRADFPDYLLGKLSDNRRLLLEDHLSRCSHCRTHIAERKGERKVLAMPQNRASRGKRWLGWAAIAAMALCALYLGRNSIDTLLAPRSAIASVDSVNGTLFLVPDRILETGDTLDRNDVIRTAPGTHVQLRLKDSSLVDINGSTELSIKSALSGHLIQLQRGDIIVQAAKQRKGHLKVQTRDSLTSVKGTVFAVSSGLTGTLVSVVEGSVAVAHSGTDVLLSPGEQTATNPVLEDSVQQAVSWSPEADAYVGMLAGFAQVRKQIAELPSPQLRSQSQLLPFMPRNMVVYGALPNLGDNLDQAVAIMEQQAAENSDFSQWWDFGGGEKLRALVDLIQTVTPHLGNEIVYGLATSDPGVRQIPVILAEVNPGSDDQLKNALQLLSSGTDPFPLSYFIDGTLLLASDSEQNLDWVIANLGQGSDSSFALEIAERYHEGVGWLLGIDIQSILSQSGDLTDFVQVQQVKHLFIDQRTASGIPENEIMVTFNGPRMGLHSFMADTGSGGAAEYISSEAIAAGYIATREPQQLFEEIIDRISRLQPSALDELDQAQSRLGIDFSNDLAGAFGAESAFSLESISTAGPAWTMAVLVNDSFTLEESVRSLMETLNTIAEDSGTTRRITYSREDIDGRTWTTLQPDWVPLGITWTYDRGYMVAASDRGTALRAIATRNGGFPLVWSASFQQQLPASAGQHPSGFIWLNSRGSLQNIASLIQNAALRELLTERDPILVVIDAGLEQIRAVSHTRLSRVFMDFLLLQELGKTSAQPQN